MAEEVRKKARSKDQQFPTKTAAARPATAAGDASKGLPSAASGRPIKWDREADIVVIGAGAMGLPAAIVAREAGADVIVVEANFDIGGHAITSGGNVPLGGGTSAQKKAGIKDSPDLLFQDLTDWSVVEPNGFPDYRFNDREIIRAFADNSAPPSNGSWPTAWSSSTRRPTTSGGSPSETPFPGKCMPPR